MCRQYHRTTLNLFLNGTKNDGIDGTCKRCFIVLLQLTFFRISAWRVAFATLTGWTLRYRTKCAKIRAALSRSTKPVCMRSVIDLQSMQNVTQFFFNFGGHQSFSGATGTHF